MLLEVFARFTNSLRVWYAVTDLAWISALCTNLHKEGTGASTYLFCIAMYHSLVLPSSSIDGLGNDEIGLEHVNGYRMTSMIPLPHRTSSNAHADFNPVQEDTNS